jgi:uncharacterized repeat protein (TIGR01451 family)
MTGPARLFLAMLVAVLATALAPVAPAFATYGKITVVKDLIPNSDTGRFDLKIDGVTVRSNAGDGESGFNDKVSIHSTHSVSETAHSGTSLNDYTSSVKCVKNGSTIGSVSGVSLSGIVVNLNDKITCTITNTRKPPKGKIEIEKQTDPANSNASFGFTSVVAGNFNLSDNGVKTVTEVTPNSTGTPYVVTESAATGWRLQSVICSGSDSVGSFTNRTASIKVSSGETVRCVFTNKKIDAAINIVKSGPALVHHGDSMTFGFAVTIPAGSASVKDVTVTDDHCSPVTLTSKSPGDSDEWLEQGETWNYTCTITAPATHAANEANPIHNIATAKGKDEWDRPVEDTDFHDTKIIHPAIHIVKRADRTVANRGDMITYWFDVTNPGDTGLTVSFGDPLCDAGTITPTPVKTRGNQDDLLDPGDPGELWMYSCTHVVKADDRDPLPNTATATGVDILGGTVTDYDVWSVDIPDAVPPTVAPPAVTPPGAIQVLGQQAVSGRATLSGQTGCASRAFTATVRGRQISRVTFYVDGRRVSRVNARSGRTRFTARINPAGRRIGVHRVTARVVFTRASGTRARTLVLAFQRCGRAARPVFTG